MHFHRPQRISTHIQNTSASLDVTGLTQWLGQWVDAMALLGECQCSDGPQLSACLKPTAFSCRQQLHLSILLLPSSATVSKAFICSLRFLDRFHCPLPALRFCNPNARPCHRENHHVMA